MAIVNPSPLHRILPPQGALVSYRAMHDEPNIQPWVERVASHLTTYQVPNDPARDPAEEAKRLTEQLGNDATVFIPGRAFDRSGTRHGRGGGWYDRFLAHCPNTWVRIGVAFPHQLKPTPLVRNAWDEPMDWLLIWNGDNAEFFETHARR